MNIQDLKDLTARITQLEAVEAMRGACLAIVGPMASSNSLYAANAGQQAYNAIRALPLPDHAALLAAAMKLPEVAALVNRMVDAERERCAVICEEQAQVFGSDEYATGQPMSSFKERFACESNAAAIRTGGQAIEKNHCTL